MSPFFLRVHLDFDADTVFLHRHGERWGEGKEITLNIQQKQSGMFPRPYFLAGVGSGTPTSNVAGATRPFFQSVNDTVTFALPAIALAGTRTGPWKRSPQHRWLSTTLSFSVSFPPIGKTISATG